jgi:hypothetical protein
MASKSRLVVRPSCCHRTLVAVVFGYTVCGFGSDKLQRAVIPTPVFSQNDLKSSCRQMSKDLDHELGLEAVLQ